ncbi:MAG: GAF domain-containing protein [Rivularia sp. ALOHA_DT_140]|nr:GAF domain-containing protein [Rivularia sp. ALOHA_DT_140]
MAKLVSAQALKIHRTQLSYILEVISKNAQRILQADVAAIDFMYQPEQEDYIYQVCTGNIDENLTSRKQKLRQKALQEGKQIFVTNSHSNLTKLFGKKNKTMVSFPLIIDHKQGFVYLEFHNEYEISQDKISLLNLFINRANNAIFNGIVQADKQAQGTQINNIYLFTKFLIDNTDKDIIIQHIVRQIFNIVGADVVIFHEYFQSESKLIIIPEIAGRLIQEESKHPELNQDDKSLMLIKHGTNIYESSVDNSEIFKNSDFVKQENITSVASIVLKVGDEILGVMFINYRRMYNFSKDEKKVIATLASAAANAIKNQRWLQSWLDTLSDIDRELITTLEEEKLLNPFLSLS